MTHRLSAPKSSDIFTILRISVSVSTAMKVTRIYSDSEGIAHFEDREIPLAPKGEIGRLSAVQPGSGVIFRETDATYDYDWHPAPQKQWIILLDGLIEIETGDGAKRQFGTGEVLLVEDVSGRGHRTRQLSPGIRRSLFIPITQNPLP